MDWIAGNSLYKSSLEHGVKNLQYICNNVVSAYLSYLVPWFIHAVRSLKVTILNIKY